MAKAKTETLWAPRPGETPEAAPPDPAAAPGPAATASGPQNGAQSQPPAEPPPRQQVSLARVGRTDFDDEQISLLKRTIAKGADDDELALFLRQCRRTGLDPFAKQIYLVKRWDSKLQREIMSIQLGIDGYRLIADRTGAYAGNDDPVFDDEDNPQKATVAVYKMVHGERCAFVATARWSQYYPGEKQGFMWKKMPHLMLGKVAESLALRKAFPAELSGLYIAEEMQQVGEVIDAEFSAGPNGKVTPDQIKELNDLIAKCEEAGKTVNFEGFLKWLAVENMGDVKQADFAKAKKELTRKLQGEKK